MEPSSTKAPQIDVILETERTDIDTKEKKKKKQLLFLQFPLLSKLLRLFAGCFQGQVADYRVRIEAHLLEYHFSHAFLVKVWNTDFHPSDLSRLMRGAPANIRKAVSALPFSEQTTPHREYVYGSSFGFDGQRTSTPWTCGDGIVQPWEMCDGGIGCDKCRCSSLPMTNPPSVDCQPILAARSRAFFALTSSVS